MRSLEVEPTALGTTRLVVRTFHGVERQDYDPVEELDPDALERLANHLLKTAAAQRPIWDAHNGRIIEKKRERLAKAKAEVVALERELGEV